MRRQIFSGVGVVLILALVIVAGSTLFTINESEQALILQFGQFKRAIRFDSGKAEIRGKGRAILSGPSAASSLR